MLNFFFNVANAQTTGSLSRIENVNGLIARLASMGNVAVYLLIAFAVLYIVYYTVIYFVKGESGDESRTKAGLQILWGIVGLFIIVSLWGLVNIFLNTFSTNTNVPTNRFPTADFINQPGSSGSANDTGGELTH